MEVKPIYCGLALGSASVRSDGEYLPCCNILTTEWDTNYKSHEVYFDRKTGSLMKGVALSNDPSVRINSPGLKKVRSELLNGVWPKPCYKCKEVESYGIQSMRQMHNTYLVNLPLSDTVDPSSVKYLDLTFETKCNSKCMTCGPTLSSFWEDEWYAIYPDKRLINMNRVSINEEMSKKIVELFPNLERISFIGGEPTISEEHLKFVKLLVEKGRSKHIHLSYITNLTGTTDELLDIWKHFKNVNWTVSVDGYGPVNEYIRYPFPWSKVDGQINTLMNFISDNVTRHYESEYSLGLSCTVSVFNVHDVVNLFKYWIDTADSHMQDEFLNIISSCYVNKVTDPSYMSIDLLSTEYRKPAIEKLNEFRSSLNIRKTHPSVLNSLETLKQMLSLPHKHDREQLQRLKYFITKSDEFRKRNINDYIPGLMQEIDRLI